VPTKERRRSERPAAFSLSGWPRIQLIIVAILFSTGGVVIKGNELTSWQIASFRCAIAVATLLILAPETRRGWSWRLFPVSLAYAGTLVFYVLANKRTTAANAIFLQSTAPAYLVLLSPLVLHEKLRRSDLLLLGGIAAGLAMLFLTPSPAIASAPEPVLGNVLGMLSGLSWALTVTGLRWLARGKQDSNDSARTVTLGNLVGCLVALPMALPIEGVRLNDALGILFLGIFQIGVAYLLLSRAIRHVRAFEATTLLLLEPALNPMWTWLVLSENPGSWAIAGGVTILLATLTNTWRTQRTTT
jgi:drug/metabolite transporter (DMT)-like permease